MKSRIIAVGLIFAGILVMAYAFMVSYITFISNLVGSVLLGVVERASPSAGFAASRRPGDFIAMQFETGSSHFIVMLVIGVLVLVAGIVLLGAMRKRSLPNVAAS